MGDVGIGKGRPMAGMGVVHGDDVGHHRGDAGEPGVVGHGVQPTVGLDQVHRMIDIAQPDGELVLNGRAPGRLVQILQFR